MPEPERAEQIRAEEVSAARLAEWVDARLEGVEPELAARVRSAIDDAAPGATVLDAPHALVRAAVARLEPLAEDGCSARESAIELLAVDALVTLACEALADTRTSAASIGEEATAMVRAIAATMPELDGAA